MNQSGVSLSDFITAKFEWQENPFQKLNGLKDSIRNRIARIAVSAGASAPKAVVISLASERYGYLKKSIRIKIKSYQNKQVWLAIIGAKSDYTRTKGKYTKGKHVGEPRVFRPAKYLWLVDRKSQFMLHAKRSAWGGFQSTVCKRTEVEVEKYLRMKR